MSRRQQRRRTERRRRHMAAAGSGLAVVATLSTGGVAQAAAPKTFTVTNLNATGSGSLAAAVAGVQTDGNANAPGDSIVFASGLTGSIHLTAGQLYLSFPVQILGPGADKLTVVAAPNSRIFRIQSSAAKVSGLTLTGGAPKSGSSLLTGGAIYAYKSPLELDGMTVSATRRTSGLCSRTAAT